MVPFADQRRRVVERQVKGRGVLDPAVREVGTGPGYGAAVLGTIAL